jgi:hypothetical protein
MLTLIPISVSANQAGSSPKKTHPFMAKLLTINKISSKFAKVTTGCPYNNTEK